MSAASPFRPGAVLALVGIGTALFVAMLWMIGAGMVHGSLNNGGAHGASKGLTGYAGLAALLERGGWTVSTARSETLLHDRGVVVLTPPQDAAGADIERIVAARRAIGPTVVISPKWLQVPLPADAAQASGAKPGWVALGGTAPPRWDGFLDSVGVQIAPEPGGAWHGDGASGRLPAPGTVLSGSGPDLVSLLETVRTGRILAAYVRDGGTHPNLASLGLQNDAADPAEETDAAVYPVVVVFDPDLLDNYGMASRDAALYAVRLFEALAEDGADDGAAGAEPMPRTVTFDLTLNGLKRSANLLTLAFTPPFLAATLCLLMAAFAVGWRAFVRFGPARSQGPAIAFGKRALVENAGGLIRRSGRLHLLAAPYAALVRDRLARTLALPRGADNAATEAAIDRLGAVRAPDAEPFSRLAGALRAARRPAELLRGARALHALERMLTR